MFFLLSKDVDKSVWGLGVCVGMHVAKVLDKRRRRSNSSHSNTLKTTHTNVKSSKERVNYYGGV